jgi:ribosomal protein L20A (L18A)
LIDCGDSMKYEVSGIVTKGAERKFTMQTEAQSEARARDNVCKLLGSNQGAKRSQILIKEVRKVV